MAVRDPRHNSDHFMVVGCLCGASPREHSCYLGRRTRIPLRRPGRQIRTWVENSLLSCGAPSRSHTNGQRATTRGYRLFCGDLLTKESPRGDNPGGVRGDSGGLGRYIRASLKEDRLQRATTAGEDVKILLTGYPRLPHESWRRMWGWYIEAVDHALPPA